MCFGQHTVEFGPAKFVFTGPLGQYNVLFYSCVDDGYDEIFFVRFITNTESTKIRYMYNIP